MYKQKKNEAKFIKFLRLKKKKKTENAKIIKIYVLSDLILKGIITIFFSIKRKLYTKDNFEKDENG